MVPCERRHLPKHTGFLLLCQTGRSHHCPSENESQLSLLVNSVLTVPVQSGGVSMSRLYLDARASRARLREAAAARENRREIVKALSQGQVVAA